MEFNGQLVAEIKLFKFKVLPGKNLFFPKVVLRKTNIKKPSFSKPQIKPVIRDS